MGEGWCPSTRRPRPRGYSAASLSSTGASTADAHTGREQPAFFPRDERRAPLTAPPPRPPPRRVAATLDAPPVRGGELAPAARESARGGGGRGPQPRRAQPARRPQNQAARGNGSHTHPVAVLLSVTAFPPCPPLAKSSCFSLAVSIFSHASHRQGVGRRDDGATTATPGLRVVEYEAHRAARRRAAGGGMLL
mgnify:CR=1 FL=1